MRFLPSVTTRVFALLLLRYEISKFAVCAAAATKHVKNRTSVPQADGFITAVAYLRAHQTLTRTHARTGPDSRRTGPCVWRAV